MKEILIPQIKCGDIIKVHVNADKNDMEVLNVEIKKLRENVKIVILTLREIGNNTSTLFRSFLQDDTVFVKL